MDVREILGLNVGDVYAPDGTPRTRIHVRREIAKRGTAGDVFLPDRLAPKMRALSEHKVKRGDWILKTEKREPSFQPSGGRPAFSDKAVSVCSSVQPCSGATWGRNRRGALPPCREPLRSPRRAACVGPSASPRCP